ncbi:phage tail tape measure protein [Shewanella baltica]|uniref:phage tail tape measure protein n=3 Tax=Shewanella baltica TaxID=62322 RepID=UPI00217EDB4A|nr:phage tail tape measure protein [Shewanella baltica]MCS6126690.1 phage tail tape measure protein [Shewanella baltica]MCS6138763.1 phage tail tape measure protein [Shewanella baltica]MCS6144952.1 phage tail tape measure protein [Shewanella baltica]MCS6169482.1 phage tail tape measure protein [Shewanella baltica]MCS6186706.1 phage tail tape measure protein [Shewanella baltica]
MANRSLSNLTLNLIAETGSFSAGMDSAERSLDKVARAAQKQKNDLVRLMGQIDPLVSEYAKLDKMERQLQKHRETGTLAGSEYDLYAKRLATMRSELGKTGIEYEKTGMSAKQMAFATRGLPAQFTDIAVSLQGGQNPMTVFLQQGGQLKDMFGGVGPAAKAMGGYIAGLVNPFTVGATAAGVMALAYYQGSIEADRLRNALILTGNSAGTTSDELMEAAKRIDAIIGTQRQAAAALAEVANTGKFTASQIELVGRAAIQMENVTGKAIAETVAEFAKLADDPVKAAEELNKKYNFLTASVYEQIVALKESGKTTEAAELAFNAYSAAIDMRTKDITANLGRIEGAWKSVKEVAAEGWDATIRGAMYYLNGPDKKQELAENAKAINELIAKGKGFGGEATRRSDELARLQARGNELVKQIQFGEQLAKQEAERAKINQQSIEAQRAIAKVTEETLTNEQKRTKAIKEYNNNIEKVRKGDANSALLDPDKIKRDLASIEEKFKDTAKKTKAFADDAATTYLMRLRETQAGLQGQLESNIKLTQSQKELVQFEQQIADIKNKDVLTAQQKSLLAEQSVIRAQLEKNVALDEELKKRNEFIRLQSYSANLTANLAAEQQRNADKLATFGLGDKAQQRLGDRQGIERDIERAQGKALSDNLAGKTTDDEYQQQLSMLKDNLTERLAVQDEYYLALDAKQADWTNGARSSMQNYIDAAADMAGQTKTLMDGAFGGMTDALTDFVTTGKADFAGLAKSILADIAKIAMQKAIAGLVGNMFGGYADGGVVGDTGFSSGGYTGTGGKYEPAGIVHKGEVVWSQRDVAAAGGVATVEAMRKGNKGYANGGIVGGAAYNGVPASATAGASVVHVEVNIDQSGNATTKADTPALNQFGSELGKFVEQKYRQLLANDLKPNGQIGRTIAGGYR